MLRIVLIAAVVATVVGAGAAVGATGSPDITRAVTITVFVKQSSSTHLDLGTHGLSAGDEDVIAAPLYDRSGVRVGRVDDVLTFTKVTASGSGSALDRFTATLGDGQIVADGAFAFSGGSPPNASSAVTGGTGRYANVRGQVDETFLSNGSLRLVYRLLP
jgi:hypothetical protein